MTSPVTFLDGRVTVYGGHCLDIIATMSPDSVDAVVTDPPYELKFMGKGWDGTGIVFLPATWKVILRVLKPGGHLVAFGAPRNHHRLTCAIEDAGFEIRDCLMWIFGSGYPKSLDVSKAIDRAAGAERKVIGPRVRIDGKKPGHSGIGANGIYGASDDLAGLTETLAATDAAREWQGFGTALKPAYEPIILARKPLIGTVAENVLQHGTGALNIDGCRVPHQSESDRLASTPGGRVTAKSGALAGKVQHDGERTEFARPDTSKGRWPANIVLDGSEEVVGAFPANLTSGTGAVKKATGAGTQANAYGKESRAVGTQNVEYGDTGSAARFFYRAKADADDRLGSKHPTVKPVDLMRWLVRLVTPPGGTILDPFAGTGTTGEAAYREGFNAVLIEREAEYQVDIARRMELVLSGRSERRRATAKKKSESHPVDAGPLFGVSA